jgi:diaminohydroxyphosphoribosylaminopyrimidine deaminase / 5-amino-6-(5-phosphoribosylamino)uracil reductase
MAKEINMEERYMKRAIELASQGKGFVNPNPLVGAVIVKNGKIIGEGYHKCFGQGHAEVNAFLNATEDVTGADMYVTLEPCSHYGKTPPCALKIIEKKIKRVFISQLDPNPLVNSQGVKLLEDAGIEVVSGILANETKEQNEIFLKYIQTKKPFVAMKYAMTLDGKLATKTRDSKWITNEQSRAFVHDLRNQYMAIMIGVGTVIADNPSLDTRREKPSRNPIRIIIDSRLEIPLDSKVIETAKKTKTIIITGLESDIRKIKMLKDLQVEVILKRANPNIDLNDLMIDLGAMQIDSILIEGGSYLLGQALLSNIVDKAFVFIAPKMVGGKDALTPVGGSGVDLMKDAISLTEIRYHYFGDNIMIEGKFTK